MSFASDGGRPISGVIQGSDGFFYGTAICGGAPGSCDSTFGTIFRLDGTAINTDDSAFTTLHSFTGGADGGYPQGGLTQATDGFFYGMTNCGGGSSSCVVNGGDGTIYRIDSSGNFETMHVFNPLTDGTGPYGSLVQGRDGSLYGLTWCGGGGLDCLSLPSGEDGGGTVFKFDPVSRAFSVLHTFGSADPLGCKSLATLVEDRTRNGAFYGTTNNCGVSGEGTVFAIDTSRPPASNVSVLHAFAADADGGFPVAGLTFGPDGTTLYGTTQFGGQTRTNQLGFGTIFKINIDGTGFATLYTFEGLADGGNPNAGMVHAHDGMLYGTAFYPSPMRPTGTLFRIDPGTRQFDTVYTFTGDADGQNPSAALAQIDETRAPGFTGSLVGTTMLGPTRLDSGGNTLEFGAGVVFRFVPPPVLLCPARPAPVNATSPAGAQVSLNTTFIDPANLPSTITWRIDGGLAQTDNIPAALSSATSSRTMKSLTATYTAGLAGTAASRHTVSIEATNTFGFSSTCTATVEVDKLDQTIAFAAVPVQTYSNPNGMVALSATSLTAGSTPTGLAASFSVLSGPGFVTGDVLTITGAGTIVVQAFQNGNGQYNPATSVSRTITVNKANQTLTFAPIANQTFANPAPTLSLTPSSTSGLPVTLSVIGAATLTQTGPSAYTLTLTGAGTITVTASQPGDANFNAARNVAQTITVLDASESPLRRFVAFSTDLTWLHTGTIVTTGDIGANLARIHGSGDDYDDDGGDKDDSHRTTVRLDNKVTMQQATSRVVGEAVWLGPSATIYNLFNNILTSQKGNILGMRVDAVSLPYATMPAFPSIAPGTQDITVKENTVAVLAAGSYRNVKVENGGALKLLGGLYQMTSLSVQPKATVQFEAPSELRVQTGVDTDSDSKLVLNPAAATLTAAQVKIYVGGDATIGERGIVFANIYAPGGTINLKAKAQGTGAFVGNHVIIGSFSRLTLDSSIF